MKNLIKTSLLLVLVAACSEAEIDTALEVLTDDVKTVAVTINNVPESQANNPLFIFTLDNSEDIYASEVGTAVNETVVNIAPPPGNSNYSVVVYIPTVDDWNIKEGLTNGFYSSFTGILDRNGSFITQSWTNSTSFGDSGKSGASSILETDLFINGENELPSPDNEFSPGAILSLFADVTNNTGEEVSVVEFLVDGTVVETINEEPYSINFNTVDLEVGEHTVTVQVSAGNDVSTDELEIVAVVDVNEGPFVDILGFTNGEEIERQTLRTITANVSDDRGISSVQFIINGSLVATDTDDSDGYSFRWDTYDNQIGTVSIEVLATDTDNVERSDFVNVVLTEPDNYFPRVSLTGISDGQTITAGTLLNLGAVATDPDGDDISGVEWYYNFSFIGQDLTSPYITQWNTTGLTPGEYDILVVVYDQDGVWRGEISSETITITIQ